jgi:hypothetical protein
VARYAETTTVPIDRTRTEIERELAKHGAKEFGYMYGPQGHMIMFKIGLYAVRITLTVPESEQQARARWRALLLVIKAKLVAVSEKISTIEREFLADVIGPDGRTVFECVKPQLSTGKAPTLMIGVSK